MGRNAVHLLPIPPIALRLRTGIVMLSYANELAFGITTDFDAVPDVEELSRDIERGLAPGRHQRRTAGIERHRLIGECCRVVMKGGRRSPACEQTEPPPR